MKDEERILYATVAAFAVIGALVIWAHRLPGLVKVTIPPGLRKEETAAILAKDMHWNKAEEQAFMAASSGTDYAEGVYFPDTYLIPSAETPDKVADRMIADFNDKFAPYQTVALSKNVKWTVLITIASIIQREAAGTSDMALISGILWNRLNANMPLDVDSTVQYARGDTPIGWWAPITPTDLKIDSPYNTYIYKGLPPHSIDSPGQDAIKAALYPATTTCLYYLHDSRRDIHCSDTYAGQEANVRKYLR